VSSSRVRARRQRGFTLVELLTAIAVMAIAASVTVPVFGAPARLAAVDSAKAFAIVLRRAQAEAQADGCRLRVALTAGGSGFSVSRIASDGEQVEQTGTFGGARCTTNYPGGAVDFGAAGWPLTFGTGTPRAGTFHFSPGSGRSVVLQMAGRIRCS
jgi:prepilin-type N-terminal cleavage/methylation domain-containing protein